MPGPVRGKGWKSNEKENDAGHRRCHAPDRHRLPGLRGPASGGLFPLEQRSDLRDLPGLVRRHRLPARRALREARQIGELIEASSNVQAKIFYASFRKK